MYLGDVAAGGVGGAAGGIVIGGAAQVGHDGNAVVGVESLGFQVAGAVIHLLPGDAVGDIPAGIGAANILDQIISVSTADESTGCAGAPVVLADLAGRHPVAVVVVIGFELADQVLLIPGGGLARGTHWAGSGGVVGLDGFQQRAGADAALVVLTEGFVGRGIRRIPRGIPIREPGHKARES